MGGLYTPIEAQYAKDGEKFTTITKEADPPAKRPREQIGPRAADPPSHRAEPAQRPDWTSLLIQTRMLASYLEQPHEQIKIRGIFHECITSAVCVQYAVSIL